MFRDVLSLHLRLPMCVPSIQEHVLQHIHEHQRGIAGGPLLDILQLRGPRPE